MCVPKEQVLNRTNIPISLFACWPRKLQKQSLIQTTQSSVDMTLACIATYAGAEFCGPSKHNGLIAYFHELAKSAMKRLRKFGYWADRKDQTTETASLEHLWWNLPSTFVRERHQLVELSDLLAQAAEKVVSNELLVLCTFAAALHRIHGILWVHQASYLHHHWLTNQNHSNLPSWMLACFKRALPLEAY